MMLRSHMLVFVGVSVLAGGLIAQESAPVGLLTQLVSPPPLTPKPVSTNTVASVKPVVKNVEPVTPVPPVVVASPDKATMALKPAKKKKTGSSFLGKVGSSTNAPSRETIITSVTSELDYKEGVILFDKNVVVDDPQFMLKCDRLLIFMESTNDVNQVMALGNVNFSNDVHSATCDKAVYTRKDGQLVLSGDVILKTAGETTGELRGKKVVIWVDDERVEVLEGVEIKLPPGAFKNASEHSAKEAKPDTKNERQPNNNP